MEKEINNIKITMAEVKTDLKYIKEALNDNKAEHLMILDMLKDWKTEAENRFASRWVENVVKYTIGIIGASIIGAVMILIIK